MEIAVCSWSYRLSAERVAEEMAKCDVKNVHLALNPFVDPQAIVPGTAGETENVAGTGGKTYLRSAGKWNEQEVTLSGSKIKVVLNGTVIVDDDLSRYATDGTTMDKQKHPGLRNKTGRLGWISHGYPCRWRRIRIKELGK